MSAQGKAALVAAALGISDAGMNDPVRVAHGGRAKPVQESPDASKTMNRPVRAGRLQNRIPRAASAESGLLALG